MGLLAAVAYDPGTAVAKDCSALLAMTALDTTHLRLTFSAPSTGNVLVRLRGATTGSATTHRVLLGVLDGATVRLRMHPFGGSAGTAGATTLYQGEVCGVVTGLTPGNSYTWDAAYSVDIALASTNLKYGGPDDTNGADAFGAFVFEVWECANLLAGKVYDPTSAVTKSGTALLAMTALDTTNLRHTVTAPASGKIFWRIKCDHHGGATQPELLLGLLEGSTVVARAPGVKGPTAPFTSATGQCGYEASGIITATAGSHTYDAAYAVQVVANAGGIKYGGPDDATTNNAFGGLAYELWAA